MGVDCSKLSKTQKKKAKAKAKIQNINQIIKEGEQTINTNPLPVISDQLGKTKTIPKLKFDDPLFSSLTTAVNLRLGTLSLSIKDAEKITNAINDRTINDHQG